MIERTENSILITKKTEDCHLVPYRNEHGYLAIGYNHTDGVRKSTVLKDEAEATKLLEADANKIMGKLNELLSAGRCTFNPTQDQIDALISFGLSEGHAVMRQLVEGRNAKMIALTILTYDVINGKVVPKLTERRKMEQELFRGNVIVNDAKPEIIEEFVDETIPKQEVVEDEPIMEDADIEALNAEMLNDLEANEGIDISQVTVAEEPVEEAPVETPEEEPTEEPVVEESEETAEEPKEEVVEEKEPSDVEDSEEEPEVKEDTESADE